jgi:hypothetical protein
LAFVVIPVMLVVAFGAGVAHAYRSSGEPGWRVRRATIATVACALIWMAVTAAVAESGILREWTRTPPPFAFFAASIFVVGGAIAAGPVGGRLARHSPLWALVAVQAFRLPLELAMHRMYERGIMPVQMSYSGFNVDIVTGLTALVVAPLVAKRRAGRGLVLAWNVLGLALLVNVVTIAILSTPRLRYFGNQQLNVWITYQPFVWLPAVMVLAALAGHLVIFRALAARK